MAGKNQRVITSETLKQVLRRRPGEDCDTVFKRLDLAASRGHEVMAGRDPGTTERFAIVVARFVMPAVRSERAAAWKAWQILRELHPDIFDGPNHTASSAEAA